MLRDTVKPSSINGAQKKQKGKKKDTKEKAKIQKKKDKNHEESTPPQTNK